MQRILTAVALALAAGATASAATPARRAVLPPPLLPLSEADMNTIRDSGCESSWGQDGIYIFIIESRFLVRTAPGAAGLHACALTQEQESAWGDGLPAVSCGGRQFTLRHVGRTISHSEADSAEGDAVLTMSDGRNTRTARGGWGTAC